MTLNLIHAGEIPSYETKLNWGYGFHETMGRFFTLGGGFGKKLGSLKLINFYTAEIGFLKQDPMNKIVRMAIYPHDYYLKLESDFRYFPGSDVNNDNFQFYVDAGGFWIDYINFSAIGATIGFGNQTPLKKGSNKYKIEWGILDRIHRVQPAGNNVITHNLEIYGGLSW